MRLEPEFWSALAEICRREHLRIGALIRRIEAEAGDDAQVGDGGRTSAVRVFVLRYFRTHAPAGGPRRDHAREPVAWNAVAPVGQERMVP